MFEDCPHGGFCAFIGAPADGLVILPESIEVNEALDAGKNAAAVSQTS
ncbi:hypothetical protein J2805_003869 [Arthrobacter oryzae]|nr:hypothetical protein [Arthrobacter oryzae]